MSNKSVESYLNTYAGRNLYQKHSPSEYGVWKVLGEDDNCGMGGTHYQPELGLYEGQLQHVVAYAVQLAGFWAWGGGGNIVKVGAPQKIDEHSVPKMVSLQREEAELEEKLRKVREQLGKN